MRSFINFLEKNRVALLLILFTGIAIFLHVYKPEFPTLNEDDASFGYNAYSIAKTGKDEYGTLLPTRFKAFGENKLPAFAYLAAPIVGILGLSEFSIRLPMFFIGVLFPIVIYFLLQELYKNKTVSLIGAFLMSVSPWIQMTTRHAHEVSLATFLIALAFLFFFKYLHSQKFIDFMFFAVFNGLALFTHHLGKLFQPFFFVWLLALFWQDARKNRFPHWGKLMIVFLIPIALFFATELLSPTNRLQNLVFYQDKGFDLKINELRGEHDVRFFHNKATQAVLTLTENLSTYFSGEYLAIRGDKNPRFGFEGIAPITFVEYIFIFIGLYYLFRKKHALRYPILFMLLWAPLAAGMAWQESSLTRNLFSIVPIIAVSSFGIYSFFESLKKGKVRIAAIAAVALIFLFYLSSSWDFYFHHYPKRALAVRAWQSGYKDMAAFVKDNYGAFDRFYITRRYGQPYIFLLFHLGYPPAKYQAQARLSAADEYGFGQVEEFDKFIFRLEKPKAQEKAVFIAFPDDDLSFLPQKSLIRTIHAENEEIFRIYEPSSK